MTPTPGPEPYRPLPPVDDSPPGEPGSAGPQAITSVGEPGDIVIFDFGVGPDDIFGVPGDHTGVVERVLDDGTYRHVPDRAALSRLYALGVTNREADGALPASLQAMFREL